MLNIWVSQLNDKSATKSAKKYSELTVINAFPNNCLRCEVLFHEKENAIIKFSAEKIFAVEINNTSLTTKSGLCRFSSPKAAPAGESLQIIGRFSTNKPAEWCVCERQMKTGVEINQAD